MKSKNYYIFLLVLLPCLVSGQTFLNTEKPSLSPSPGGPVITVDGFQYTTFLTGERFYNYIIDVELSPSVRVELQAFYSRFGVKERIRMPLFLKARLSKNLNFLLGPEWELDVNREIPERKPRLSINTGIEYEREDGLYIRAIYNYQINDSQIGPRGDIGASNMFSLSSGIKF